MARFGYTVAAAMVGAGLLYPAVSLAEAEGPVAAEAGVPAAAAQSGIKVIMNQARIVKLARKADTIIIGNPDIADASVQDADTIVLTGKGFGVTNLVVLDDSGNPIVDEQIVVTRQTAESVRVYRRADVQTLSCTPYCESSFKTEAERTSESEMNRRK